MMRSCFSEFKVPNGKLLKVSVSFDDVIHSVRITGDFFLYPEELIIDLEESVNLLPVDTSAGYISSLLQDVLNTYNGVAVGFSADDLAQVIWRCMRQ